ncbi:MAG: hypothetical protein Kow0089_02710 [Desulfobulbaceae bacterium]
MRCPKCGYISFDIIDSCVKCGKEVKAAAEELQGSIAAVSAPVFLKVSREEAAPETEAEVAVAEEEAPLDLGEAAEEEFVDLGGEEEASGEVEMEIDLGATEEAAAEVDLAEEVTAEEPAFDLGLGEEPGEEPAAEEAPPVEEEIGISDLAPEEEEPVVEEPAEVEEEVDLAGEAAGGQGLEDLKVEGIDLESSPGEEDTSKITPSVKTGTALDDFDIDLGDLLPPDKN